MVTAQVVDAAHSKADVVAVLAPEHGFRGTAQAEHGDPFMQKDAATNLTVYSVYRLNVSKIVALLDVLRVDTVLIDLQDVGVRLYTYATTALDVAEAAGRSLKRPTVVVADRPNPLGGLAIGGPGLVQTCASRYGRVAGIPHVRGSGREPSGAF